VQVLYFRVLVEVCRILRFLVLRTSSFVPDVFLSSELSKSDVCMCVCVYDLEREFER